MTNTEIATINQDEIAALAAQMGMDPSANSSGGLAPLKTNAEHEDDDGAPLPFGTFYVPDMDELVYAKTVNFRPLAITYQLSEYDSLNNKMACRTIEAFSHSEEFIDTRGETLCGRPPSKVWKEMDKEAKKPYEDITAFTNIRGLVSYTGKTQAGEEVTVENHPVILRMKGVNYSAFGDAIGKFGANIPKGRNTWDYWFTITLDKKKNGSVTYFEWKFTFDPASPVLMDLDTFDTVKAYNEDIKRLNKAVIKEYDAQLEKKNGPGMSGSKYDLDNDLDDAA